MVITCYAWIGNIIFMLFYFMNVIYMAEKTGDAAQRKIYGFEGRLALNIDHIMDR